MTISNDKSHNDTSFHYDGENDIYDNDSVGTKDRKKKQSRADQAAQEDVRRSWAKVFADGPQSLHL